jgi:hypothetical protein
LSFAFILSFLAPAGVHHGVAVPSIPRQRITQNGRAAKIADLQAGAATTTASAASQTRVEQSLAALPLCFIESKGQTDGQVSLYIQGSDKTIYFTPQDVTFALTATLTPTATPAVAPDERVSRHHIDPIQRQLPPTPTARQRWAVKLDFVGANPNVRPVGALQAWLADFTVELDGRLCRRQLEQRLAHGSGSACRMHASYATLPILRRGKFFTSANCAGAGVRVVLACPQFRGSLLRFCAAPPWGQPPGPTLEKPCDGPVVTLTKTRRLIMINTAWTVIALRMPNGGKLWLPNSTQLK